MSNESEPPKILSLQFHLDRDFSQDGLKDLLLNFGPKIVSEISKHSSGRVQIGCSYCDWQYGYDPSVLDKSPARVEMNPR